MRKLFCRQPKLLICIELKLAEILGVCGILGIFYGFGILVDPLIFPGFDPQLGRLWFSGFIGCVIIAVIFLICCGIYHAIKANWQWAERISKK